MLQSNRNASNRKTVIRVVAAVAILVAILAYLYVSQPSTVRVAPEPARTGQAK
jgi:hypothetical protein